MITRCYAAAFLLIDAAFCAALYAAAHIIDIEFSRHDMI